ncbi:MAG TPA: PAS domain S-box protein, partial [Acidobacteriota bacterium]|nr:PAS domain S-box protein [Acidobacteriota bacterium]
LFNVQMDVVSVRDESGRVRYRVATMQDITDRKQAEEIIRESEARYRNLVEVSPDAIFINRDRQIVFVNRQGLKLFGAQTSDQLLGKSPYDLFHPDYHELIRHRIQTMLATKKSSRAIEEKIVRLDGQVVDVEVTASSFLDQEKQAIHVVLRDITERKQAEHRLQTQARVSRILAEANTFGETALDIIQTLCEAEAWDYGVIWKVDKKANQLECVDVWARPEPGLEALVAQTRSLTFAPNMCLPGRVWIKGKAAGDEAVVGEHHLCPRAPLAIKSGLCSTVAFPIVHQGETLGVMDFMSRTRIVLDQPLQAQLGIVGSQLGQFLARNQAQEEVHRFVSGSPAVIFALKREEAAWKPAWTSENVFDLTGYHADEANDPGWWASHLHPEDQDRILATESTLETTSHRIVEYRFRRQDGTYFWVRDEKRVLFDSHHQPTEIVGSWSDITERVRLEEQLRQSQKMEAVGQLAGGIAHDFNNLLTVIVGYSDLLLAKMPSTDPKWTNVADIKHAGEQAAVLTRQLLAFSRKQILEPKIIDLNETVSQIEKMLRRLIGEDIILTTILPPSVSKVKVDPGQLEQVIINLAVNARDAMPQGGHLTIETGMTELDEEYCHSRPECTPGWYTQFSLSDTGCGMSPEIRNHIFEPFFTTKEQGKGTGLGLATVFGIVKQSGGHIEVYSEVGVGTSFKIYLPAIEEKWTVMQPETPTEDAQHGNEIILLVEDEAIVRTIARLSLETFGYQVIEAGSGDEALELAKTLTEPLSLLITDVIMPKMNGRQLATQFQHQFPNLKVLLMSGYTDDAIIRHGVIDDTYAFIQKPFTPNSLAKKVREVLEEKNGRSKR